jgi:hypothetical protein
VTDVVKSPTCFGTSSDENALCTKRDPPVKSVFLPANALRRYQFESWRKPYERECSLLTHFHMQSSLAGNDTSNIPRVG